MGHRNSIEQARLYLVLDVGERFSAPQLSSVLDKGNWASALLRGQNDRPLDVSIAKPVVAELQRRGIAALVAGDVASVVALKADGLHLSPSKAITERYHDARQLLGPAAIIGADAGRSRHDAMELGEGGADYVAFGIPPYVGDRLTARERQLDLIAWWSDIFEPPCVAIDVETAEDAQALARAGADFVGVTVASPGSAETLATIKVFIDAVVQRHVIA